MILFPFIVIIFYVEVHIIKCTNLSVRLSVFWHVVTTQMKISKSHYFPPLTINPLLLMDVMSSSILTIIYTLIKQVGFLFWGGNYQRMHHFN